MPGRVTASDLEIKATTLRNWMNRDEIDSGRRPVLTTNEHKKARRVTPPVEGAVEEAPQSRLGVLRQGKVLASDLERPDLGVP